MTETGTKTMSSRIGTPVLGTFIDALDWETAVDTIVRWGTQKQSKTVCLCNVHSAVTASEQPAFANALRSADMVLPDGHPIAWMLRKKGFRQQDRIAGPDLMLKLCESLQPMSTGVFLFGSSKKTLRLLRRNLRSKFPNLIICGSLSPRYGDWTSEEGARYLDVIKKSGAGIVFVGLGCPKQEIWMAEHSKQLPAVLIGVGAAFDFHSGAMNRAPLAVQRMGLEWAHRLWNEPQRLWKRYLVTNTRFLIMSLSDLLTNSKSGGYLH